MANQPQHSVVSPFLLTDNLNTAAGLLHELYREFVPQAFFCSGEREMYNLKMQHARYTKHIAHLRIHDLVAKTAHVSHRNTLRVLIALRAVRQEVDLSADEIVNLSYSSTKPTPEQARACNQAYLGMQKSGWLQTYLYEVEQII